MRWYQQTTSDLSDVLAQEILKDWHSTAQALDLLKGSEIETFWSLVGEIARHTDNPDKTEAMTEEMWHLAMTLGGIVRHAAHLKVESGE